MCASYRLRDPKSRFMFILGNLSLAAAILLWNFTRPLVATHPWIDGFIGLFFGFSMAANVMSVYRTRYCRPRLDG